ncbi:MAG: hypothetical protein U1A77_24815 [Pirellulales bacterium]
MTQTELDRHVANATGETLREIRRRGFSIADPVETEFDPEPSGPAGAIDWDEYYGVEPPRHRVVRRKRRSFVAA